jgi:glycosyltransferase involved in cell wall biosynthesis
MKIGFDARVIHFPGIGRYIQNLLEALIGLRTDDRFVVYIAREEHCEVLPAAVLGQPTTAVQIRMLPATFSVKEQWIVPRAAAGDGLDLFHTPHYVVPLFLPCPCVATYHDLTYYKHPASLRSLPAQAYYRLMHRVGHRRVERAICVSESTARDMRQILGVPAHKLRVIHSGIGGHFCPVEPDRAAALRQRLGIDEFLLYVGTKKRFKNVPTLLRAFRALMPDHPRLSLVLAGRGEIEDDEIPHLLEDAELRPRVRILPPLPDEEMPVLYAAARALVLPSFNEGFGFTIPEAMACGTPCLCADAASLPEVAGDAALFFPPHDSRALARVAHRLLSEPGLAADLSQRGLRRARTFDWSRAAASTYEVYESVNRHGPSVVGRRAAVIDEP